MKAIILITSIFYLLGLKISHTIDFKKKCCHIDNIVTINTKTKTEQSKSITLKEGLDLINKKDSVLNSGSVTDQLQKTK